MATNLTEWYGDIILRAPGCPFPLIDKELINTLREFCEYTGIWHRPLTPITTVVIEQEDDIAFVSGSPCTITSTDTDFDAAGLAAGDIIVTDHTTSESDEKDNTGPYTLDTVAANTLTLASTESLVSETAGDETTISKCTYALSHASGDITEVTHVKFDQEQIFPKTEEWLDRNVPYWRTEMQAAPNWYTVDKENKYIRLVYAPNEVISDVLEVWVNLKPAVTATSVETFIYSDYRETIMAGALARLLTIPKRVWTDLQYAEIFHNRWLIGRNKAWYDGHHGITGATTEIEA